MTDTIEPGDLISSKEGVIVVSNAQWENGNIFTLIAKGPGWTRHDGSATNPVPGAQCEAYGDAFLYIGSPARSECWHWHRVQFYRITRPAEAPSQPPAPQPGWVATVTLEYLGPHPHDPSLTWIKWPTGFSEGVYGFKASDLPWSPPPPPPWEPEIGKEACWLGDLVIVRGIFEGRAWVEDSDGDLVTIPLSKLSPPKGGA